MTDGYRVLVTDLTVAAYAYEAASDDAEAVAIEFEATAPLPTSAFGNLPQSYKWANQYHAFFQQVASDANSLPNALAGPPYATAELLKATAQNYLRVEHAELSAGPERQHPARHRLMTPPAPPVEHSPGTVGAIWGMVFDPGGDPAAIKRAATAIRTLSTDITKVVDRLKPAAANLKSEWEGSASDAFWDSEKAFATGLTDYANQLRTTADYVDQIAASLHEAQVQARNFMISVAVALGVMAACWWWGGGEAALAEIKVQEPIVAGEIAASADEIEAAVQLLAKAQQALKTLTFTVFKRFVVGVGSQWAGDVLVKLVARQNPLDPNNWTAKDATGIVLSGAAVTAIGRFNELPRIKNLINPIETVIKVKPIMGRVAPALWTGAEWAVAGGIMAGIREPWLNHNSLLGEKAWASIGQTAAVFAVVGPIVKLGEGGLGTKFPKQLGPQGPYTELFPLALDVPASGAAYAIFSKDGIPMPGVPGAPRHVVGPTFQVPSVASLLPSPGLGGLPGTPGGGSGGVVPGTPGGGSGGVVPGTPGTTILPPPHLPAPHVIPQHTVTVHRGDTLSEIALRELGDGAKHSYDDLARINGIANPNLIYPGQKIIIPEIIIPAALERTG